jgi:hypothetical protein
MGALSVLMGLQTVMQLSGQHQQAKQQEQAYKAQAQAAQQNAAIMSRQREQQAEAYAQKQSQLNDRMRLARGQALAAAGSSGLTSDGSVSDILASSEDAYRKDSMNLLQNQRNDAWSTYVNEVNYRNQANAYNAAAKNAKANGKMQMFSTLVGAAANAYSKGMIGGNKTTGTAAGDDWYDANSDFNLPASNMSGFNLYNQAKKNNPFMDNAGFTKWSW